MLKSNLKEPLVANGPDKPTRQRTKHGHKINHTASDQMRNWITRGNGVTGAKLLNRPHQSWQNQFLAS